MENLTRVVANDTNQEEIIKKLVMKFKAERELKSITKLRKELENENDVIIETKSNIHEQNKRKMRSNEEIHSAISKDELVTNIMCSEPEKIEKTPMMKNSLPNEDDKLVYIEISSTNKNINFNKLTELFEKSATEYTKTKCKIIPSNERKIMMNLPEIVARELLKLDGSECNNNVLEIKRCEIIICQDGLQCKNMKCKDTHLIDEVTRNETSKVVDSEKTTKSNTTLKKQGSNHNSEREHDNINRNTKWRRPLM